MTADVVRAGPAMDFVVWLVVIAFWVIVQVINRSRRGADADQPPRAVRPGIRPQPPGPQRSIEDEMREFLTNLSGMPSAPPAPPPVQSPAASPRR